MTQDLLEPLFAPYRPAGASPDRMRRADGTIHEHWDHAVGVLERLGIDELRGRKDALDRMLDDEGVSYRIVEQGITTRWPLDPVPALVTSEDWGAIERGVIQRAVLLDLVLRDLYGPRDLLTRGLLPPEVVFDHPGFLRACDGITGPVEQQLFTYAADLGFTAEGVVVMADRSQAPSGAGYTLANRMMVSRLFPSLYRDSQVHRVAPYFRSFRAGLERVAGATRSDDPTIVVLSPGSLSETAFEHAYTASYLGYPLVEGGDLTVREGRVFLRTLGRFDPIDVIVRRVDADWCDPLSLRPESQLGVPGLVEATRRGTVAVVNPLGSGVLENPALATFLPAIARHLLGQDLLLPTVPTWWCGDDADRAHVLANLDQLVLKPLARGTGSLSVFGGELARADQADLRAQIEASPHQWVGQVRAELATTPSFDGTGIHPRSTILRTFAVGRGDSYAVMAGGLTRVSPDGDSERISNQAGAPSKDTWVLRSEPELERGDEFWIRPGSRTRATDPRSLSPRAAENFFWLGRYAERAEAVTRLLRATHDRRGDLFDGAGHHGTRCVNTLLGALTVTTATFPGFVGEGAEERRRTPDHELRSLACDADRDGTLAHAVRRLLTAAEGVRDQLSLDTWLVVGSLDDELAGLRSSTPGRPTIAQERLGRVLQGLLALQGLVADSMVRDSGWFFMDIGRRLERALQLAMLLRATLSVEQNTATDSLVLESVLVTAESIVTYRRRYRSHAQVATVLDLLVGDPDNPRSLRHQIDFLADDLAILPGGGLPAGGRHSATTVEERTALELRSRLRTLDSEALAAVEPDHTRAELDRFLAAVIADLAVIGDSLASRSFAHLVPQQLVVTGAPA